MERVTGEKPRTLLDTVKNRTIVPLNDIPFDSDGGTANRKFVEDLYEVI